MSDLPYATRDRNLLIGILALQMDFVDRDQLITALNTWVLKKDRSLDQILLDSGAIDEGARQALLPLVDRYLSRPQPTDQISDSAQDDVEATLREIIDSMRDGETNEVVARQSTRPDGQSVADDQIDKTLPVPRRHDSLSNFRYSILRPHARGGLGKVSVALDQELNRQVALKEIQDHHADDLPSRARFMMEAEVTGRLEHPGIVPVYGLGIYENGRPYYAMRLIKGETLKDAIARFHSPTSKLTKASFRSIEFRQLIGRFIDVCNAIHYAHSRGILHRDLKPGNIMLGAFGETLVVDWGLAKIIGRQPVEERSEEPTLRINSDSGSAPTQFGSAIGTPGYMSPEQAEGRVDQLGPATDIYSLGAILYCLLTGGSPIRQADLASMLQEIRTGTFSPPSDHQPAAPAALEAICLKSMAVDPQSRYASARQVADELEHWLADEPVVAYREPYSMRAGRWCRRHQATCAALLVGTFAIGLAGATWQIDRHNRLADIRSRATTGMLAGNASSQAGNFELATTQYAEALGLCRHQPQLAQLGDQLQRRTEQIERYRRFTQLAGPALTTAAHGFQMRFSARDVNKLCLDALNTFDVVDNPDWHHRLVEGPFTDIQQDTVKDQVVELLIVAAMQIALRDSGDDAGIERTEQALQLLDQAAGLRDPSLAIWALRWRFHRRLGNDAEAERAMTEMQNTPMQTANDYYLMGSITLNILKDPQAARNLYLQAVKLVPNHYGAHFGLFLCASEVETLGSRPQQLVHLTTCLVQNPDPDLFYFRGMMNFGEANYKMAHLDFDAAVQLKPDYAMGYFYRGRMAIAGDNDWKTAESDFDSAAKYAPDTGAIFHWRSIARAKNGDHRGAVVDAERSFELDGDALGCYYAARGYAQAALAVSDDPEVDQQERSSLLERYQLRAIEILQHGIDQEFSGISRLGPGSDFDPLWRLPQFRQLLAPVLFSTTDGPAAFPEGWPEGIYEFVSQLLDRDQFAEASDFAAYFEPLEPTSALTAYNLACVHGIILNALAAHESPPTEINQQQASNHRRLAIDALGKSIKLGFQDRQHIENDPDLASLRQTPEFKQMIDGI
jgi:serine/threonine protein kinase/tetratricopeptide (TPR) repeat protein